MDYSDDEDEDEVTHQQCIAAESSLHNTTLLHRNQAGVGLSFDALTDMRDCPADHVHHGAADRLHSTSASSQRTLYQPSTDADGVDNGLDSTTYF